MKYIHLFKTNSEFTTAYNGPDYIEPWLSLTEETMTISSNKPKLTAITFGTITWVTDVSAKGGTATKDNCEFEVYGNYDDGTSVDISPDVTVTGELVVPSSTSDQRHEAGQLTLTASYGRFTVTGNVTAYQEAAAFDFSAEPLTFNILSAGTINWTASNTAITKTIDYKLNDGEWTSITSKTGYSPTKITVYSGDKIQFRGNNTQYATSSSKYNSFSGSTASFEVEGNIMSLLDEDNFKNNLTISSNDAFAGLFKNCTKLVSAENLILPATTLAEYCYSSMFKGCTSLTQAPALPATTLENYCYECMFDRCTSLTTAPELPATTLDYGCYDSMFYGCTSLTTAPELPVTTLPDGCYRQMFYGCTSLATAPELPATTLTEGCYNSMFSNCTSLTTAPALPATTLAMDCYRHMFDGCTSLTTAPKELPATTLTNYCYFNMFKGCTSLTQAPALPATTLAEGCYQFMFNGCTSLNYIKCLATDISVSGICTYYWVRGVASTGTFIKAAGMTGWSEDENGIPRGWTVQDAS